MTAILLLLLAYLLGSIPFGLLLTRAAGLGDIRRVGSGNIGATNVLRTGHKGLAAATLLLDGCKGAAAVLLASALAPQLAIAAGLLAMIGHIFPVWLRFKGGKGVATAIGVLLAVHWLVGAIVCLVWLAVFAFTRISSLAALAGLGSAWIAAWILHDPPVTFMSLAIFLLVAYTHRQNVRRLMSGEELHFRGDKP
ncbi:MAG: glycerol-3-phosphate 1-O-acyltransferase PlsY [Pseudomonadota bacterium]|nr:glycerol-3-phosphate 1-O-acyltransferase PlsY [Pseudomonadota bacterium]